MPCVVMSPCPTAWSHWSDRVKQELLPGIKLRLVERVGWRSVDGQSVNSGLHNRPSAPMGRDAPGTADKEAAGRPPSALFDPQLVPGAAASLLDANAPAGSTALGGGSDPALVRAVTRVFS